jgi:hypothetical protein
MKRGYSMRRVILAVFAAFSCSGHALDLAPIPPPKDPALTLGKDATPVPCDQLVTRLVDYNRQARQHDQSLTGFLGQVSDKITLWYSVLSPLEGTTQTIDPQTFAPLKDGADKVTQIKDMAFDNSDLLANELDTLIESLRACQAAPTKK